MLAWCVRRQPNLLSRCTACWGSLTEAFLLFLLCKSELRFDSNQRMATILQTLTWCVVHTRALASVVDSYGDTESF